ncbi:isochorismatase family cysteine hydrolase [Mycoplasmopsis felis]|uniref:isochorismatase family cysteine hydrolase n=1 Tax=Mycoplasmopsis felis TaxID=33923 RepID=UPI002AFDF1FF|nr:isochorismatase family cysteine hydrolase [Mycoplasmopsis felis]WQQ03916.1 isochorismatase family cysteine hydrolase [Mycoplasmopsis felis]
MSKKLTIVVDMLNGFAKEGPLSSNRIKSIIPNIIKVLDKSQQILFVCDAHSEDDIEMEQYPIHCLKNTKEAEIISELKPYSKSENSKIIYKNTTNAFYEINPKIWDYYDEFELVGCCTDICVLQLSLSLKTWLNKINSNKIVSVIENAVQTFDSPNHNGDLMHKYSLEIISQAGIIIK